MALSARTATSRTALVGLHVLAGIAGDQHGVLTVGPERDECEPRLVAARVSQMAGADARHAGLHPPAQGELAALTRHLVQQAVALDLEQLAAALLTGHLIDGEARPVVQRHVDAACRRDDGRVVARHALDGLACLVPQRLASVRGAESCAAQAQGIEQLPLHEGFERQAARALGDQASNHEAVVRIAVSGAAREGRCLCQRESREGHALFVQGPLVLVEDRHPGLVDISLQAGLMCQQGRAGSSRGKPAACLRPARAAGG